jgi:hypothetical protein
MVNNIPGRASIFPFSQGELSGRRILRPVINRDAAMAISVIRLVSGCVFDDIKINQVKTLGAAADTHDKIQPKDGTGTRLIQP